MYLGSLEEVCFGEKVFYFFLNRRLAGDLHDYHQISEHVIFRILITVGRLVLSSAWFLLSATMVMTPLEFCCTLTQPPERIVVPVEALVFQAKEVLKKPRLNTPL